MCMINWSSASTNSSIKEDISPFVGPHWGVCWHNTTIYREMDVPAKPQDQILGELLRQIAKHSRSTSQTLMESFSMINVQFIAKCKKKNQLVWLFAYLFKLKQSYEESGTI